MHLALQARSNAQQAEDARREAEARIQSQLQHEQAEQARAQRLEAFRAALTPQALEAFHSQAEEALAQEGYGERTLGYTMLLRLRLDDLLEQAFLQHETQG
jgi:hypothetical protein